MYYHDKVYVLNNIHPDKDCYHKILLLNKIIKNQTILKTRRSWK